MSKAVDVKDFKLDYDKGQLKASASVEVSVDAGPIVDKVLDLVGKAVDGLIPGDQSELIEGIKEKVKKALEEKV